MDDLRGPGGVPGGPAATGRGRPWLTIGVTAIAVVAIAAGVLAFGLIGSGGKSPASSSAATSSATGSSSNGPTSKPTDPGTAVLARLPVTSDGTIAWSPDGANLLVSERSATHVWDRLGHPGSDFGPGEGWLGKGLLVDGQGHVWALTDNYLPTSDRWPGYVVASGHGSAAVVVAQPLCVGDTEVAWYSDGRYDARTHKATPIGWSDDGRLYLEGHLPCSGNDAETRTWKGNVDVVDGATKRVLATAPGVRGELAFNSTGNRLAAQSDSDLEIVNVVTGTIASLPGVQALGWADEDHLYILTGQEVELVAVTAANSVEKVESGEWRMPSAGSPQLVLDASGKALRVVGADGAVLLDFSGRDLVSCRKIEKTGPTAATGVQTQCWSPDGRTLALYSADRTAVVLISIDPTRAAR